MSFENVPGQAPKVPEDEIVVLDLDDMIGDEKLAPLTPEQEEKQKQVMSDAVTAHLNGKSKENFAAALALLEPLHRATRIMADNLSPEQTA